MLRRLLVLSAVSLLGAAAPAFAQTPAAGSPIDIGPALGARAPAVTVIDSRGAARDLAGLTGAKGVVLVFFRSARWCPFCQHQLIDLKALQAPLAQRGYTLTALSYDKPEVLAAFAQKQEITYTLVSDEGSKTIDAFALRDPQYAKGSFAEGVPRPSIFVIDRKGVVRGKLALEGYKVRPGNDDVLKVVDAVK
ncbi:peroxiredoxin-like family protein [soil metagenome]